MLLVPLLTFLVLIVVLMGITRKVGATYGRKKPVLLSIHILLLLPWFMHFMNFLRLANSNSVPEFIFLVPLVVLILAIFSVYVSSAITNVVNILIPSLSFIATYYFVMPTIYEAVPNYKFDNVSTVWLFIWTIGATLILVAYILPDIAKRVEPH